MEELPGDIQAELAKAVGAYARAVVAQELPAPLRRFRSFRPRALPAHAPTLLEALEDEVTRKLIVQWLDDKPSLPRAQQGVLRLACERPEGWMEELAGRSAATNDKPVEEGDEAASLRDALAKEKDKVKRARADSRRAKEQARTSQREAEAAIQGLRSEIEGLNRRLSEAEAAVERARAAETGAGERLDKELRRARRDAESAVAEAEEQRRKASEERRRATELQRRVEELERALQAQTRRARGPTETGPKRPSRREPLPVPLGLLPEAPETLEAWLRAEDVTMIVDGYNVVLGDPAYASLDLEGQRARLVDELRTLARRTRAQTIVVFDGSEVPPGTVRRRRGSVRVEYSRPDESADDHIVGLLESLPPAPVVMVSSDRELQDRAGALGATAATSGQLLAILGSGR